MSPELVLKPYLDAVLALTTNPAAQPLFTMFYLETSQHSRPGTATGPSYLIPPRLNYVALPDLADTATVNAEATFREALKVLRSRDGDEDERVMDFWPLLEIEDDSDNGEW